MEGGCYNISLNPSVNFIPNHIWIQNVEHNNIILQNSSKNRRLKNYCIDIETECYNL